MSFTQGLGKWLGCAEVYSGEGRFLGNATDRRHVQDIGAGKTRIDVSFIGPIKMSGQYFIQDRGDHRLYEGPANVGSAEALSANTIDANAYWASVGLSQKFFLMTLPEQHMQLSLAYLSRGEQLMYVVVGENHRVDSESDDVALPNLVSGTSYDLQNDPCCGRGELLLHRNGVWSGKLNVINAKRECVGETNYIEEVSTDVNRIRVHTTGNAFASERQSIELTTNGWQAWSGESAASAASGVVGSYSLSGGRALGGHFHFASDGLRLWRREVVSSDGRCKAILHTWYRGGERIGAQFGVLMFERWNI
jgi:hypothetical protein